MRKHKHSARYMELLCVKSYERCRLQVRHVICDIQLFFLLEAANAGVTLSHLCFMAATLY